MALYAALLPLITALFGLGSGMLIWIKKKGVLRKQILLWLTLIFTALYALSVFLGMSTDSVIFWQAAIPFLSLALLTGMFFTIQITRDFRETDSVFLLLCLISTAGGVLSVENTTEFLGVTLPVFSPILFGVFLVFVVIAWGEVLYNLIIVSIASKKTELKKYRKNVTLLTTSLSLIYSLNFLDVFFVYAGVLMIPTVAVFATLPFLLLLLFMYSS
ncbi:MAG: hypothetical protein QW531_00175 [Thermoplasmata archaeon]